MSAVYLPEDLKHQLKSLTKMTYFITHEEDASIKAIHKFLMAANSESKSKAVVKIYNQAHGLISADMLFQDWETRGLNGDTNTIAPNKAFDAIYKEDTRDQKHFYIITDADRWLKDPALVRRLLNTVHQLHDQIRIIKCFIFLSTSLVIPAQLNPYIHVVRDDPVSEEEAQEILKTMSSQMKGKEIPAEAAKWMRGLNRAEIQAAVAQSLIATRHDKEKGRRVDPQLISDYKRNRIKKTDLLNLVDVSQDSFEGVGGLDKFKKYAETVKPSWTKAGHDFGLVPPKGVLCVGVWGCGKSRSVKALGHSWGVPVIQLEMGKLRSSGVGDTESNVYRVIGYLESMAPCIAWVDEAEKSFAGVESSGRSDAGTTARMLGILSTWHQETTAQVCLCLTANSITTLPLEFTNRIEDRFFFDVPDVEDRIEILKIQLKRWGNLNEKQIANFPLRELSEAADKMVPREMEQGIRQALRDSFHLPNAKHLDANTLLQEFKNRPRILTTMDREVKEVLDWVGYDKERDEGVRARMASSRRSANTMTVLLGEGVEVDAGESEVDTQDD